MSGALAGCWPLVGRAETRGLSVLPRSEGPRADDALMTDAELVRAAGKGDHAAFETLYARHKDQLAAIAYRFTGDQDLAMDVLQESFAYLLTKLPSLELTAKLSTYMYPIVKHTAITLGQKRRKGLSDADPEGAVIHTVSEGHTALREAVASLPAGQAEVLLMRYAHSMTEADIASALEIPPGTVKSRLHHAIRKLREAGLE